MTATSDVTDAAAGSGQDIRKGLVFAAIILAAAAGARFAAYFGAAGAAEWAQRLTMAVVGAFLAVTGNAIPKTLTPLDALACDAAAAQRFQRRAGWAWTITGAALALVWFVLPIETAGLLTFGVVPVTLYFAVQAIRLRWGRRR